MADNSGLIKILAAGAAAYVAYTQGWLSFLGTWAVPTTTTGTSSGTGTGTGTGSGTGSGGSGSSTPPPNPKANVLDGIYTAMVKAANAPSAGLGVDQWGYFLNEQLGPLGLQAPDPVPIFTAMVAAANQVGANVPAFDRSTYLVTAPAYWNIMAPALKSQLGLSGLGIYGGLGALVRRYA